MEFSRRNRLPLAKPPVWVNVAVLPHVEPFVETSNPAGAAAVMASVKLPPVTPTVEAEAAEAVP